MLLTDVVFLLPVEQALVDTYGNQTDIADVGFIREPEEKEAFLQEPEGFKHPVDMCDYKYLLLVDGNTLSGRVPTLAVCKSMLITHESPWEDMVTSMLSVRKGYGGLVTVGREWDGLGRLVKSFEGDSAVLVARDVDARAEHMQFLLSPLGISCYIWELLQQTANLLRFEVNLHENLWGGAHPVPIEEFLLQQLQRGQPDGYN